MEICCVGVAHFRPSIFFLTAECVKFDCCTLASQELGGRIGTEKNRKTFQRRRQKQKTVAVKGGRVTELSVNTNSISQKPKAYHLICHITCYLAVTFWVSRKISGLVKIHRHTKYRHWFVVEYCSQFFFFFSSSSYLFIYLFKLCGQSVYQASIMSTLWAQVSSRQQETFVITMHIHTNNIQDSCDKNL